jgi:hypothetical protein
LVTTGTLVGSGPKGSVSVGAGVVVSVAEVSVVVGKVVSGRVSGPNDLEHDDRETVIARTRIKAVIFNLIIFKHLKKLKFRISNCISIFSK